MRWFQYAIAEDEIRLLTSQKMFATEEDQGRIVAEIEQRFEILCEPLDQKQMESMMQQALEQQLAMMGAVPLGGPKTPAPKTKLDVPVSIPPELLQ